jgi:hypothetical protein
VAELWVDLLFLSRYLLFYKLMNSSKLIPKKLLGW